jgi:hypothetical protein
MSRQLQKSNSVNAFGDKTTHTFGVILTPIVSSVQCSHMRLSIARIAQYRSRIKARDKRLSLYQEQYFDIIE